MKHACGRWCTRQYDGQQYPAFGNGAVGAALLGLRVGDTIHWELPGGASTHLEVLELEYQPEAAGDFLR